jgi:chemotaxis protein methyltransferase CheR
MNDALNQLFIQLIATHTGLQIRPQDQTALLQKILTRMKAIKLALPEKYYQLLANNNQESKNEWRKLVLLLTINESYFMRDKGQFALLEKVIFPELIEHKRKLHKALGIKPTLRIWSAGCSTGEEPYSLAIILKQLIPDWERWEILVLGTDINEKAIEKAQHGIYSNWSFRLVDPELQKRYFNRHALEWEIDQKLRRCVNFSCINLASDNYPNIAQNIYNMDLIMCRNVFVYFEAKYISLVLKKFSKTLRPGGYLMTGHAEVHGQIMNEFKVKIFPESIVYQAKDALLEERCQIQSRIAQVQIRESGKVRTVGDRLFPAKDAMSASFANGNFGEMLSLLTVSTPLGKMLRSRYVEGDSLRDSFASRAIEEAIVPPLVTAKTGHQKLPQKLILEANNCFKNKAYAEAINKANQAIALQPQNFEADYLLAQIYANLGKYSQAIEHCNRASKVDPVSVFPYYLQAHIAEEQEDLETAKNLLKRIIYLCPSFISAYLELGNIYHKEGKVKRAVKMYNSSCDILKALPPNTLIEQHGKMTASQVLMDVKKKLLKLYSQ